MRHLLCIVLVLAAGCKRATTEPPPNPSVNLDDALAAPESGSLAKPDACNDIEDCNQKGMTAVFAGDVRGVDMLAYACVNDSPSACRNLSAALRIGSIPEDPVAAHAAALRGCKLADSGACFDLGEDELLGLGGTTQDLALAHEHFMFACKGGSIPGCRYLGVFALEGKLGSPDPASALQWFDTACEMGDPESCFNCGVLIVDGVAGEVDLGVASAYMTRACELGDADGCAAADKIATVVAAAAPVTVSKIPDANLQIGSASVNGFTVESLECRVEGGGMGLMGNMALLAALAERKAQIDKCGAKGTVVEVIWSSAGGKITKAEGVGSEGACVAKVLKKLSTPVDGECAGTIVLGT